VPGHADAARSTTRERVATIWVVRFGLWLCISSPRTGGLKAAVPLVSACSAQSRQDDSAGTTTLDPVMTCKIIRKYAIHIALVVIAHNEDCLLILHSYGCCTLLTQEQIKRVQHARTVYSSPQTSPPKKSLKYTIAGRTPCRCGDSVRLAVLVMRVFDLNAVCAHYVRDKWCTFL